MGEKKLLYSPGFGSGWSTWNTQVAHEFATWAPLIEAVEALKEGESIEEDHPAVASLIEHCRVKLNDQEFTGWLGELGSLAVFTGDGGTQYTIVEYDGHEAVQAQDDFEWY